MRSVEERPVVILLQRLIERSRGLIRRSVAGEAAHQHRQCERHGLGRVTFIGAKLLADLRERVALQLMAEHVEKRHTTTSGTRRSRASTWAKDRHPPAQLVPDDLRPAGPSERRGARSMRLLASEA